MNKKFALLSLGLSMSLMGSIASAAENNFDTGVDKVIPAGATFVTKFDKPLHIEFGKEKPFESTTIVNRIEDRKSWAAAFPKNCIVEGVGLANPALLRMQAKSISIKCGNESAGVVHAFAVDMDDRRNGVKGELTKGADGLDIASGTQILWVLQETAVLK